LRQDSLQAARERLLGVSEVLDDCAIHQAQIETSVRGEGIIDLKIVEVERSSAVELITHAIEDDLFTVPNEELFVYVVAELEIIEFLMCDI
jgi:hypothetical protein